MTDSNAIVSPQKHTPISETATLALVDLQNKELEFKVRELEQRKIEDQHSFEFAQKNA
ncbi:MAG: hypothetical protein Q4E34_01440 [Synergistaceae bacterium]|nr:hypothetical protein [Synergistaceae bacterium]